jgi:acetyl-CoA carboxylase biotin carboxyl carrier protein
MLALVVSVSRCAITVPSTVVGWRCRGVEEGRFMIEEIRAEMVASVWKIVVAEGDAVSDGDTLVILESMKMEIPVLSEVAGTVAKLAVAEGDVVQQGDLIAVVE